MSVERSYLGKLTDFGIESGQFTGDSGEKVNYRSIVIEVQTQDGVEKIILSGANAPKPSLLETILKSVKSKENTIDNNGGFLD